MTWQDRLREAAYKSPGGVFIPFLYENVSSEYDKKTTGFEFPDFNGTYVQELGNTSRKYPLRVIFAGNDYDLLADAFDSALRERGVGTLDHPMYGVKQVIPFGTIRRRDDLKTAANQAIFDVTFWETIGIAFPEAQDDPAASTQVALDAYNIAAAEQFDGSVVNKATTKGAFQKLLDDAKQGLQKVADAQAAVSNRFNAIYDSVNNGIDVLIGTPLVLAAQTVQLLQTPARAFTSIRDRLSAYGNLLNSLLNKGTAAVESNQFYATDVYASTYVSGKVASVINNEFITKTDALIAAEDIIASMEALTVWRDNSFETISTLDDPLIPPVKQIDTGEAYQKLQDAVAVASGFLVSISFSLKQERSIVLDRARTIIDLTAELYGDVDKNLDFLINSNDLTGSEILELPIGKEIVYYV